MTTKLGTLNTDIHTGISG